jgi:CHAT domain-containing protein/tetratricopeptide (TPR) repeat protein
MSPLNNHARRLVVFAAFAAAAAIGPPRIARGQAGEAAAAALDVDFKKAEVLQSQSKFTEAAALLEDSVARIRRAFPAGHPEIANALAGFGYACSLASDHRAAEAALREALEIARARPAETGDLRLSVRNNLVEVMVKGGKAAEAMKLSEESVNDAEKTYGANDRRTSQARETMAKVYLSAKRPADAVEPARAALKSVEAASKPDDAETVPFRHTLSVALMEAGRFGEAEALLKQSQAIVAKLPAGHEYALATANDLAALYQLTNRPREAAASAEKATAGGDGGPAGDPAYLSNLAAVKMLAGQYDEADAAFQKALALARDKLGDDHPDTAKILGNLAHLNTLRGRFAEAERYARACLDAARKKPGTVAEAKAEVTLAGLYYKTGRLDDAAPLMESALKTMTDQFGADHPDTVSVLHDLAALDWAAGRTDRAVAHGEKAWAGLEKGGATETPKAGLVLVNLGQAYLLLGRFDEAKNRLTRAVDLFLKLGRPSTDSATADNALATYHGLVGNLREADSLSRRAADTMRTVNGPDHPETCNALDNLATRRACAGDWRAAADQFDETRRLRRAFLWRTLPALSEDDQIRLIEVGERISRDAALSLAILRRDEPGVAARSAEWVLNSKALTLAALAERAVAAREPDNADAAALRAARDKVRDRLAMLATAAAQTPDDAPAGAKTEATRGEYAALAKEELDLSRRLGLALPAGAREPDWVTLERVRAALPADGVLVEYVRVYLMEYTADILKMPRPSYHYAAWVVPPVGGGEVALVDLGPAETVEHAVADALRAIRPGSAGEAASEQEARTALGALARLVMEPLGPLPKAARRWVLSPDAALWLVPWAALPSGENRYAVEDHLIDLTASGRDLLAPASTAPAGRPAIFADPDYDLDPASVAAEARAQTLDRAGASPARASTSLRGARLPGAFDRLRGTLAEAAAVAPLLQTYAGEAPEVFLDKAASETVFKSLRGPKALLLSTHGVFLDAPGPATDARPSALRLISPMGFDTARGGGAVVNPLLRGSLVLAGYNRRDPAATGAGTDDGLLTGLEVVGVDLRGTELVVLSACDTALGDALAGEGVAGLRQAFQLAGARSVVATLWKVDDFETYQLIAALFEGLAHKRSTARALREAQLAVIADRRVRLGAADPHYWAAFTLTGDPGTAWRDEPVGPLEASDLPALPRSLPDAAASLAFGAARGLLVSPLTGLPDARRPWADLSLAIVLITGGGYVAWRWWTRPRNIAPA